MNKVSAIIKDISPEAMSEFLGAVKDIVPHVVREIQLMEANGVQGGRKYLAYQKFISACEGFDNGE